MKTILAFLLLLTLTGCTSLQLRFNHHVKKDFQQAIAQHLFRRAETIAKKLPSSHQHYKDIQKALPALHKAEQKYVQDNLKMAKKLAQDHRWQAAIDLLKQTRRALPSPPSNLKALQQSIANQQQQQIDDRLASLLTHEAHWLLKQHSTILFLDQQQQDKQAARQAEALINRQPELASQLVQLGQSLADRQHWGASLQCLQLAKRLGAKKLPNDTLKKAKHHLYSARKHRRQKYQQTQLKEARKRLANYQQTRLVADLLDARNYLQAHPDNSQLDTARAKVKQLSKARLQHDMTLGDSLYARGNYLSAKHIWQQLRPLYPDNRELGKKLDRVSNVLHTLHSLRSP